MHAERRKGAELIRHVVLFRFKPETGQEDRDEFAARVRALPETVPGVLRPEVGVDLLRTPRSYDVGLFFGFADRTALDRYQTHPNHVPVVETAKRICDSIVALDYELPG